MIEAIGPNGEQMQFPDGTPDAVIDAAAKKLVRQPVSQPTQAPQAQVPEPLLNQATKDSMLRNSLLAGGGMVGGAIGTPLGPLGMLGGSVLGTAMGEAAFGGIKGRDPMDTARSALQEAKTDAMFTGGLGVLRPIKQLMGGMRRSALGVGPEEIARANEGLKLGVDLAPTDISRFGAVTKASQVVGRFPFLGTPVRTAAVKKGQQVIASKDRLLERLGPSVSLSETGLDLNKAAQSTFKGFRNEASERYNLARQIADDAGEIIPTSTIKARSKAILEAAKAAEAGRGTVNKNPILDVLETVDKLPDKITGSQFDAFVDDLDVALGKAKLDGFDLKRGLDVKKASEFDLRSADNDEFLRAINKADDFYRRGIKTFQTATAQKFNQVSRGAFKVGLKQQGYLNEDELFRAAFNTKSPRAMKDLRGLVGNDVMNEAVRGHIEKAFFEATEAAKSGHLFAPKTFMKKLGIVDPKSTQFAAFEESLKGSGLSANDLKKFSDVAIDAFSTDIPDVSSFIARRATLGGAGAIRSLIPGLAVGGAGVVAGAPGVTATVLLALGTRQGLKMLSNPQTLKLATESLDTELKIAVRRTSALRLLRLLATDEQKQMRTPHFSN